MSVVFRYIPVLCSDNVHFSARYGRNRSRLITVPAELDSNSTNYYIVNAALTAGLYPKILAIDPSSGQMRTITNNQAASFHPSSVNFKKKPSDFGINYLAYFTLMYVSLLHPGSWQTTHSRNRHSKKLYAWETGPVDDIAMVLLCGECDFKVCSFFNSSWLDGD